ncbi:MAG: carboxymuconolactone decarboxylase family protein [Myxococcota bacterium]
MTSATTSARIPPLCPPYDPEVAHDLERLMPPGYDPLLLFRTVAHNPRVLRRMRKGGLLDAGSIEPLHRELVILRTTARCGSEYEWGVHVAFFAGRVGLSPAQVQATVSGTPDDPAWTQAQALLVQLCDALHEGCTVPEPLFAELRAVWSAAQLVELVMLVGLYHAISMMTNALALPPEPGAPRFDDRPAL